MTLRLHERLDGLRRLMAMDPTPAPVPIPPDPPAPSAMDRILEDAIAPECRCFVCRNTISHDWPTPGCRCANCEGVRALPAPAPRCESCRFFTMTEYAALAGECRRRAPIAVARMNNGGMFTTEHPKVHADVHWCGDYEATTCPR